MNALIGSGAAFLVIAIFLGISYQWYQTKHHVYLMPVLDANGNLSLLDKEGLASVVTINPQTGEISIVSTRMYRYFNSAILHLQHMNQRLKQEHLQYHPSVKDLVFIYKVELDFEINIPRVVECTDVLVYKRVKQKGPETIDAKGKESPVYKLEQVTRPPVERLR